MPPAYATRRLVRLELPSAAYVAQVLPYISPHLPTSPYISPYAAQVLNAVEARNLKVREEMGLP